MDEEVIIRRDKVEDAIGREINYRKSSTLHVGIDVSSGDSNDMSVICVRDGFKELERESMKIKLRDLYKHIIMKLSGYACMYNEIIVNIDTTGLGIQLGQDLSDYFYDSRTVEINEINFSFRAMYKKMFKNCFTEMFFNMKYTIEKASLLDIQDSKLSEDLGSRRFEYDIENRFLAERKKEFIKRHRRSPDEGDAVLLAFYDRSDLGLLEIGMLDEVI